MWNEKTFRLSQKLHSGCSSGYFEYKQIFLQHFKTLFTSLWIFKVFWIKFFKLRKFPSYQVYFLVHIVLFKLQSFHVQKAWLTPIKVYWSTLSLKLPIYFSSTSQLRQYLSKSSNSLWVRKKHFWELSKSKYYRDIYRVQISLTFCWLPCFNIKHKSFK